VSLLAQSRTRGEARRALLRARGLTLAALARRIGCHLSTVSRVNAGTKRSAAVERAIARALGLAPGVAFPEWYGARSGRGSARRPSR
jgi:lambda repressor-like predicted transcriptional regulator